MAKLFKKVFVCGILLCALTWVSGSIVAQNRPDQTHSIVVSISKQRLYLIRGKVVVASFACSTGKEQTPTPIGHYPILAKHRNYRFENDDNKEMEIGPTLDFKHDDTDDEFYAIHGLNRIIATGQWIDNPKLIGRVKLTEGCVMLTRKDMKRVYQWSRVNTILTIRN